MALQLAIEVEDFMPTNDRDFFKARAAEERDRADASANPDVAKIHLELAERYEALAARDDDASLSEQLKDLERRLNEIDAALTREQQKLEPSLGPD